METMKNRWKRKKLRLAAVSAAAVLAAAVMLGGCGGNVMSAATEGGCYAMPQAMMSISSERNRYEAVYTDAIWDRQVEGTTFENYLMGQVETFLETMRMMNLLAKDREVELDGQWQERMELAAKEYYGALTEDDRAAMDIAEEDVQVMYREYCLANQLVERLTEDMNLEVSDNEAKVIVIREARTGDTQAAQNAAAALMQEGADFDRVMSDAGIPVEELRLGRGETDKAYEDAVFALESGEVSGQLTDGTDLCFVKCVNAYDEAATRERKEQIFEERRRKAFEQILEQFGQGKKAAYPEGFFGEVSFDEAPVALGADFFAIYEKYAGQ